MSRATPRLPCSPRFIRGVFFSGWGNRSARLAYNDKSKCSIGRDYISPFQLDF